MSEDSGFSFFSICGPNNLYDRHFYVRDTFIYAGDRFGGLWLNTTGIGAPSPMVVQPPQVISACEPAVDSILLTFFDSCNNLGATLIEASVTGSPQFTLDAGTIPRRIQTAEPVRIRFTPDMNSSGDTAHINLRLKLGWKTFDTTVAVIGRIGSQEQLMLTPILTKDRAGVNEVTMLEVRSDKDVMGKGLERIEFDLELNTDVLGVANYNSTYGNITVGADQRIGKTNRIPITITGTDISINANTPLVTFTLQPFVSDTMQTDITVTNVRLNGGDADYERCTLSAEGSGASFTLAAICGDSLLSKLLDGKRLADILWLRPNPTRGDVEVSYRSERDGVIRFDIIDDLGRIIASQQIESQTGIHTYTLPLTGISNGSYYLRLTTGTTTSTARFVKQ